MPKEATARCKEKSITEIKEKTESLGVSIDCDKLFSENNTDTSFSAEMEKKTRDLPAKDSAYLIKKSEFVDRIDDLEGTDKERKLASIRCFGEKGNQEHIAVLDELEKDEDDAEIKSSIKKAMLRLNERINSNRPKVKMKVRMMGRIKPLPVDEDDVLLDDSEVYVSHVKSSVKVKMKARMNGRVKPLPVDEEDIIFLYD